MTASERTVLITGGEGRLARALAASPWPLGWRPIAAGRHTLDITRADQVAEQVHRIRPVLVVNAAAFTGVDLAESEDQACFAVNAIGAGNLAQAAAAVGAGMIHISTDFVFDGRLGRPYIETDAAGPLNVYGASKLAGERLVLERHPEAVVLRTAWLLGGGGGSFIDAILSRAARGEVLRVVSDQTGSPTDVGDLARGIVAVAARLAAPPRRLYHLAGSQSATWHEIAQAAVDARARRTGQAIAPVTAIASEDRPSPARRPRDSRLDSGAAERELGVVLPGWRDRIADWSAQSAGADR